MKNPWTPDLFIDDSLATRLIEVQFPELSPVHIRHLGIGWDNAAYLVNKKYVFRFPRRSSAARLLEMETKILPVIAGGLPIATPIPRFIGEPSADFLSMFVGCPYLPGEPADRCDLSDEDRENLIPSIAGFLSDLHGSTISEDVLKWAPGDENQRSDIEMRAPKLLEKLVRNRGELNKNAFNHLSNQVESFFGYQKEESRSCWVHGDFYSRHLLIDEQRRLTGIIDWGDAHIGDSALDLSIAFTFLPPGASKTFMKYYGSVDAREWDRARFRAIHYGVILLEYGIDQGDAFIERAGRRALSCIIESEQ